MTALSSSKSLITTFDPFDGAIAQVVELHDLCNCPSNAKVTGIGRPNLLLRVYLERYLSTDDFSQRMMQKESNVKISGSNNDI
jgi:hypothetical protein